MIPEKRTGLEHRLSFQHREPIFTWLSLVVEELVHVRDGQRMNILSMQPLDRRVVRPILQESNTVQPSANSTEQNPVSSQFVLGAEDL